MKARSYFQSMAGRIFVLLLVGVVGSASLALGMASARRVSDHHKFRLHRLVDRLEDFVVVVNHANGPFRKELVVEGIPGIKQATGQEQIGAPDPEFARVLSARLKSEAVAFQAAPGSCFPPGAAPIFYNQFSCWVVTPRLANGERVRLQVLGPRGPTPDSTGLDPVFLSICVVAMAILAFYATRIAAGPLRQLNRAAQALAENLEAEPLPERGPFEVRQAAEAFNAMQKRLREHVAERTQLLASITHDLQTPMTRLRLWLEKVEDPALRSRLIDDLGVMQALIREGLDYARSNQVDEPFATIALDQLLEILVDDAVDAGKDATLVRGCGCDVEVRPRALQRCLGNLLDNALKYGGRAEVSADHADGAVRVRIHDHGPGIPADKLALALTPFVRLSTQPAGVDGVGLGLTIAKNLAESNSAELGLRNHPDGGLEASLTLRRGVRRTSDGDHPPRARDDGDLSFDENVTSLRTV